MKFQRQYENLSDEIRNILYKASIAPIVRALNSSKLANHTGILPKRIVICGCPRSGTTLMNELMRCFDNVYVMGREEPALRFPYLILGKRYIVTKYPRDFNRLEEIVGAFKDPFVIFMLRDPRDVVVSRHYKQGGGYLANFDIWEKALRSYLNLDYSNKLLVKYEDLIRRPNDIQKEISGRLGLEPNRGFGEFHRLVDDSHQDIKSLGGIRPIDASNSGKYKLAENRDRIKQQLEKFPRISRWLVEYGYELDSTWENEFSS